MNLFKFLKNKGVLYAIILAIFYQVAMVGLYIYGYHVLPGNTNQLGIHVVNQDGVQGAAIQKELISNLPFKNISTVQDLNKSKNELDHRKIQMIIVIPSNFINDLTKGNPHSTFTLTNPIQQRLSRRWKKWRNQSPIISMRQ